MKEDSNMTNEKVLRFSLCVYRERQEEVLRELHFFAREQHFRHVSRILSFTGSHCKILPVDTHAAVKQQSLGLALANGRLLSFLPEHFSAFSCQLPNKRLMFFGFANYPQVVQVADGQQYITPWDGKGIWHSHAYTLDTKFSDKPDDHLESHRIACSMLRFAQDLKVLEAVEDSTGCFSNPKDCDIRFEEPLGSGKH